MFNKCRPRSTFDIDLIDDSSVGILLGATIKLRLRNDKNVASEERWSDDRITTILVIFRYLNRVSNKEYFYSHRDIQQENMQQLSDYLFVLLDKFCK